MSGLQHKILLMQEFSCHDITMTEYSTSGAITVDTIVVDTYSSISYLYAVWVSSLVWFPLAKSAKMLKKMLAFPNFD